MDYSSSYDSPDYSADYARCAKEPTEYAAQRCQDRAQTRLVCEREAKVHECVIDKTAELLAEQSLQQGETFAASIDHRKQYGTGKWLVREGKADPIDDSRVVFVSLEETNDRANSKRVPTRLFLVCSSNKTKMYITWHDYITDSAAVTHRFDKETPITRIWTSSTDKTASFYYGSGREIAKKLMLADRFVARTTPYNENPVTAIFDTQGLSKAIEPLRDACKW